MDTKRFQIDYSENSITYWPAYDAGKIGFIYFVVLGLIFIATSIWILLDNPSSETRLEIQMAFPIVVLALCVVFGFIYRAMHVKIVVSDTGIEYFKNNVLAEIQISWEDISAVYFRQDLWYGRKSCEIFLKKTTSERPSEKGKCDFKIPVHSVDEQKLLQFIPRYLWKNNPW